VEEWGREGGGSGGRGAGVGSPELAEGGAGERNLLPRELCFLIIWNPRLGAFCLCISPGWSVSSYGLYQSELMPSSLPVTAVSETGEEAEG
jgi:hypothetical protein